MRDAQATAAPTLHGFCWGSSACSDNGTNTPVADSSPQFGFWVSSGSYTSDFLIDILVPTSTSGIPGNFLITGTHGGTSNTAAISVSATLVSTTPWSSGRLDAYLGLAASPTNSFGSFTGGPFDVFQANLGQTKVQDQVHQLNGPLLSLGALPQGAYIVAFLDPPAEWIATANSGAILETARGSAVPEPATLALLGAGVGALGLARRRRAR